jgi:dipeptide transport system permease protein
LEYAQQGARVVALPSMLGGLVVLFFGTLGGLLACVGSGRAQAAVQGFGEVVGALPRLVVVLVVALLLPQDMRGLTPIALTWALLAAPGAMDEAASVAGRLGGARFVEALRAHGFSRARIYLYHIVALNLRPVVVRQAIETVMQVVFLEIALSYLALSDSQPSFTHNDSVRSWADILYLGYQVILDVETGHALALGLGLVGVVALMSLSVTWAVRAR